MSPKAKKANSNPRSDDDLDFTAAPPAPSKPAPSNEPTTQRRRPGRPPKQLAPPPRKPGRPTGSKTKTKKSPIDNILINNNIYDSSEKNILETNKKELLVNPVNMDAKLTQQEASFLELYLDGRYGKNKAMILAGYNKMSQIYRYKLADMIIRKYERQTAGDSREIFRAAGFGELTVAQGMKKLGQKARSEMVRARMHEVAAKCLGLIKDAPAGGPVGIQIVFTCSRGGQVEEQDKPLTIDLTPIPDRPTH
jgi:hypothetical protein